MSDRVPRAGAQNLELFGFREAISGVVLQGASLGPRVGDGRRRDVLVRVLRVEDLALHGGEFRVRRVARHLVPRVDSLSHRAASLCHLLAVHERRV